MASMLQFVRQPWPWFVAVPLIGLVVPFVFWYGGKKWGVSPTLRHLCAATLLGKIEYFRYDWRKDGAWSLAMVAGVVCGGFLGGRVLSTPDAVVGISEATHADLLRLGITDFTAIVPSELFSFQALLTPAGFVLVVVGGFLLGFGTRWANGSTSGHAISGLATLQPSSMLAVIGVFVGGLVSANLLLPLLF